MAASLLATSSLPILGAMAPAAVTLLVPCYMGLLRPSDGEAARRVLERLGEAVTVVSDGCCGQPAFNAGHWWEARRVLEALLRCLPSQGPVVVPSGSCTAMLRRHASELLEEPPSGGEEAQLERFVEFSDYVIGHPRFGELRLRLHATVAFHPSCHLLRELGGRESALRLLTAVERLEVRRLPHEEECCGFGGTFTVKYPEVSSSMAQAKLEDLAGSGARVLCSPDLSCLLHLEGSAPAGAGWEFWSLPELLDRALP